MSLLRGKIPVFLKSDIGFSGVADFMYAAQASWHASSFTITVDDLVAESGMCVLVVHEL